MTSTLPTPRSYMIPLRTTGLNTAMGLYSSRNCLMSQTTSVNWSPRERQAMWDLQDGSQGGVVDACHRTICWDHPASPPLLHIASSLIGNAIISNCCRYIYIGNLSLKSNHIFIFVKLEMMKNEGRQWRAWPLSDPFRQCNPFCCIIERHKTVQILLLGH